MGSPGLDSGLEETLSEDRLSDSCFLEVVTAVGFLLLQSTDSSHCLNFACQNMHTQICIYESTMSPCPWLILCTFIAGLFPKHQLITPPSSQSMAGCCLWTRLIETEPGRIEVNQHTGEKSCFTNPGGMTPAETFISVSSLSGERMSDRCWKELVSLNF